MAAESVLWVAPGSVDRSGPLGGIRLAGHIRANAGIPASAPRDLGAYGLVYLLAGGGRYADAAGTSVEVGAGDLLLLFPRLPHSYGPEPGQAWSEIYLVFDGSGFDLWRERGILDPSRPVLHLEPVDRWAAAFDQVLAATRDGVDQDPAAGLVQVCRIQLLLAEALAEAGRSDPEAEEDRRWLARAAALLAADVRREADLADIAAQLGLSYDGFRKRFRRLAGVAPARFRAQRSVDRARELMSTTTWTDRQIAASLGYCDEFHFSHSFTRLSGQSPRCFRASLPRSVRDASVPEHTSHGVMTHNTNPR